MLFGLAWIVATDILVMAFAPGISELTALQILKGSVYVVLSAVLVYLLAKRYLDQRRNSERERHRVFQDTISASNHILRNYLNQMHLVTLEAREIPQFDREVLRTADEASSMAAGQLEKLGKLERYSVEDLERLAYDRNNGHPVGVPTGGSSPNGT